MTLPTPSSASATRAVRVGLSGLALLSSVALLGACGSSSSEGSKNPNAQSVERQSDAEYDVALDYMSKGQPRIALQHVQKSISLNDTNSRALYLASTIYLSFCASSGMASPDCRLDRAEDNARRAVKADDGYRDAKNLLGQVLIDEKKYPEAITVLDPLTKDQAYAFPHLAWGNLGWAQVLNGQVDQGISSLKNAVTQSEFCVGFYRLGVAYEKKSDWAQAEQSFTQAVTVDKPECKRLQDAWEERARTRLHQGRKDDAKADLEQCRDISSSSATGRACAQILASGGAP
jgi:type IV pilus assembly protein PilF